MSFPCNHASQAVCNWLTFTSSTKRRIRQAIETGKSASACRSLESLEEREMRLETNRVRATKARSLESSGQWETKSIKIMKNYWIVGGTAKCPGYC